MTWSGWIKADRKRLGAPARMIALQGFKSGKMEFFWVLTRPAYLCICSAVYVLC